MLLNQGLVCGAFIATGSNTKDLRFWDTTNSEYEGDSSRDAAIDVTMDSSVSTSVRTEGG